MIKNYLKIALRNLAKHRLYSFLNIFGLSVGIGCCIIILLFIQDEMGYDLHHENVSRIMRLDVEFHIPGQDLFSSKSSPFMGPMVAASYPEIENYMRIQQGSRRVVRYEEKSFTEEKFYWADSSMFNILTVPLLSGNPETALTAPNSVVLTRSMAEKYFGTEDPLGKNINVHFVTDYTVTGVVEDFPTNSTWQPEFIGSFSTLEVKSRGNSVDDLLSNVDYLTYLLIKEGYSKKPIEEKMIQFVETEVGAILKQLGGGAVFHLTPLAEIHLYESRSDEFEAQGDIKNIYLFGGIGLFILIIACLNFMNLATARSSSRAKEVGLRKVVGAFRFQLIKQFFGEALIVALLSIVVAYILAFSSLSFFNDISGKMLSLRIIDNPVLLIGLVGLFLIIGLVGGSYPALFLSSFKPVDVLKGSIGKGAKSGKLRAVLVLLQFSVSIILLIGTLIINDQLDFMREKKLGYTKEQMLTFVMRNDETSARYQTIKDELIQHPNILKVSASSSSALGTSSNSVHHIAGQPEDAIILLSIQTADKDFLDAYEIGIVEGRYFSDEFPTDRENAALINEAAVAQLGWEGEAIGKGIDMYTSVTEMIEYKIIGVVKDYHFNSLHFPIEPLIIYNSTPYSDNYYRMNVRMSPDNIPGTIAFLKEKWAEFDTKYPFEYSFVDDDYENLYRAEERMGSLFSYFTILAIAIGCLGLFGLASYSAEQRTKEIGIRKTLGAPVNNLILLLVREFTKWVIVANLIAWPVAYYIVNIWLENFHYRIELDITVFLVAGFCAFLIAVLTVSYQAVRAAFSNPVNALKYE